MGVVMGFNGLKSFSAETADSYELAAKLLEGLRLPSQPKTVAAISEELTRKEPSFKKITDLISQDPGLVAQVLKIINSPLFGLKREVLSIKTALSLLGLKNFYAMVMTSAVREALGFKSPILERVWQHSALVAKLAEQIARQVEGVSPDEAYLVGLFHDSATPVLLGKFPEYAEVIERVVVLGGDIRGYEEERFNTHHALVGAMLAKSWGLPVPLFKAIRFHHSDSLQPLTDPKSRRLTAVLMLADFLSRQASGGELHEDGERERWEVLRREIEAELCLESVDVLAELANEMATLAA